jgi:hypothetical protein
LLQATGLLDRRHTGWIGPETTNKKEGRLNMDTTTMIRSAAVVLFLLVMVVLIQRRRTRVK